MHLLMCLNMLLSLYICMSVVSWLMKVNKLFDTSPSSSLLPFMCLVEPDLPHVVQLRTLENSLFSFYIIQKASLRCLSTFHFAKERKETEKSQSPGETQTQASYFKIDMPAL